MKHLTAKLKWTDDERASRNLVERCRDLDEGPGRAQVDCGRGTFHLQVATCCLRCCCCFSVSLHCSVGSGDLFRSFSPRILTLIQLLFQFVNNFSMLHCYACRVAVSCALYTPFPPLSLSSSSSIVFIISFVFCSQMLSDATSFIHRLY